MFEESFSMRLTDADESVKSFMGSACTFLLISVTLIYAYFKFDVLLNKKDVNILSAVRDLHYNDDYIFDYSMGLRIAIAFTAFDDERDWILDPSYGELVFNAI